MKKKIIIELNNNLNKEKKKNKIYHFITIEINKTYQYVYLKKKIITGIDKSNNSIKKK